jgi:hypothetical protein
MIRVLAVLRMVFAWLYGQALIPSATAEYPRS